MAPPHAASACRSGANGDEEEAAERDEKEDDDGDVDVAVTWTWPWDRDADERTAVDIHHEIQEPRSPIQPLVWEPGWSQ